MHRQTIALVILLLAIAAAAFGVDGTISGVVTSDETGSPAIAGALVRTEGEPGYSATTAPNGSFSFTAPPNTYPVLVSAPGHTPQRGVATVTGGSTTTVNFALRPVSSGASAIRLPAPLAWGEPPAAPSAPGDSFPVSFADTGALPGPTAPQISGWNDTVKPDESFTLSGIRFTTRTGADAGTDTVVWVWARTSATGGVLRQARLWRVTENTLTATLPDDVPLGMFLVWVENSDGVSLPICINRTTGRWVGPLGNTCSAGDTKRVVGVNMSYNHGTSTSYVYLRPASGGTMTALTVTKVDPYCVQFTVPDGTANGAYKVYVHNGQGGAYGWSDPLDLTVQDRWVRGTDEIALNPTGTDDTTAIQNAIDTMSGRSTGGTVRLAAGTFKTYDQIWIKDKVRIVGAGMDLTTIELRHNNPGRVGYVRMYGQHMGIESLTLLAKVDTAYSPTSVIITGPYPDYPTGDASDIKWVNARLTSDYGVALTENALGYSRVEVTGSEFFRYLNAGYSDTWTHDSNLYGGPYGIYPPTTPNYQGETEAAYHCYSNAILENSHVETKNWPVNAANGSRNYMDWCDPVAYPAQWISQIAYKPWAKRVSLYGGNNASRCDNSYIANLTTKDVAVQDNRGEMFLFHGMGAGWFGNILSTSGLTLNLRTDGKVDDEIITIKNYSDAHLTGGQPVPDYNPSWISIDGSWAVVISGKGFGQARRVVSHTTTSVTVEKPWLVQPDSTSKITVTPFKTDHVIYNNDLNAFPVGYNQVGSASIGVDIDGDGWLISAEGNTSHRTASGRGIFANSGGPAFWCVMRDEKVYDAFWGAFSNVYWDTNPVGQVLLGNAFRNCSANIFSSNSGAGALRGEGTILENAVLSSKLGYAMAGAAVAGGLQDGFVLYRNGTVTATDPAGASSPSAPEPVYISATDGRQFLIGNTYSGAPQNYFFSTGLSAYSIPAPVYRCVKISGYLGYPVQDILLPVANAGTQSMDWTVTGSDPWISPTIVANGSLSAESTLGRLRIAIDASGLSAGKNWGYVTVSNGSQSAKVGICLDMQSGAPPSAAPVASFTSTPAGGTVPLATSFNASASYDPDGTISSYYWDFGDGAYGTGSSASHAYANPGVYVPVLTVTDNSGATATAIGSNITVTPILSSLTVSGNPTSVSDINQPIVLSAGSVGGYQVQYRFLYKDNAGWHTLRDYQSANTYTWTPSVAGYYEVKVQAKSTGSTSLYDRESNILSYPVGLIPSGIKLWLKADAGVSVAGGLVSSWADQSGMGNNVTQTNVAARPTLVDGALNGRSVVRFQGPVQTLQAVGQVLNGNTAFSSFTVARLNSIPASTYQYFWWAGADSISGGYGSYIYTTGNTRCGWGSNSGSVTDPSSAVVGTLYRIASRFTASGGSGPHELWINGTLVSSRGKSGSNLSGGVFSVGNFGPSAGYGLYGDIAEIVIYDRALTETERMNVESYLTSRWTPPTPTNVDRLKDMKALGDGVLVSLSSAKVATVASGVYSDGGVYVTEPDRSCGIKVTGAGPVNLWDNLTLTGNTDTDVTTGERVLRVTSVSKAAGTEVIALGMSGKSLTASGQLVRVWGKVKEKTSSYLTLDDGSGVTARVEVDGLATPPALLPNVGDYVSATGPAGVMAGGVTAVRVRADSDIRTY